MGKVPGVPRGRPGQIERWTCMRHLVSGKLPEQHGTGVVESGRRRGVLPGDPVDEDARVA